MRHGDSLGPHREHGGLPRALLASGVALIVLVSGHQACTAASARERVIVPTSELQPQQWRYTFDSPGRRWMAPGFDGRSWRSGPAPFGDRGRTTWKTREIRLRRTFELTTGTMPQNPHARMIHDEDVMVYVNGRLVTHRPGFMGKYVQVPMLPDAFRAGTNTLAVHCRQTHGGQCIDVGIVDLPLDRPSPAKAMVRADFATTAGPDLVKDKFAVYNCPYFKMDRWFRDIHLLEELRCTHLRYDPTWGGHNVGIDLNSPQISGTARNLRYDFRDFDRLTDSLLQRGVSPMYVMAYTPQPLQRTPGVWADKPTDMDAWRRICRDYAAHWCRTGRKIGYYEIWNEPDNPPFFFKGTLQDYLEIYRYGALGVREGDPDAKIGGPAIAALSSDTSWIRGLLDLVTSDSLPLDFVSVHNYGDPAPTLARTRQCLAAYPQLRATPILLTEYNSYVPLTHGFEEGGANESHVAASRLLHDFMLLLEETDVERVYWAMLNDPDTQERCGLIGLDGQRKASFNAFRVYMEMPVARRAVSTDTTGVEAMASCDDRHAEAVIWSMSDHDHEVTVTLDNIPHAHGTAKVRRIDRRHASYYDDPRSDELQWSTETSHGTGNAMVWHGTLPAGGVIHLRARSQRP